MENPAPSGANSVARRDSRFVLGGVRQPHAVRGEIEVTDPAMPDRSIVPMNLRLVQTHHLRCVGLLRAWKRGPPLRIGRGMM